MFIRPIFHELFKRAKEPRKFIQVLLGPRQVGKTTLALQLGQSLRTETFYITADTATLEDLTWLKRSWDEVRSQMKEEALLIIDEIQKIPHWSELIKLLWDEDTREGRNLKVVLLGSSPWLMQKGLSESLAGRFEIIPITHWSFAEMQESFGWSVEKYIYFGGYPGPAPFATEKQLDRWLMYINDALIETTISRDILLMTQVNKPILLRRLFHLGTQYSGQILSFQKMLSTLADAGNTTTLSHYLELLSGAGLITGINKFSREKVRSKGSIPKLLVYNTALISALSGRTYLEAKKDHEFWGRLVESTVGAHLLNVTRGTRIELFYWRDKNEEVDFVLRKGDKIVAIEVKSSKNYAFDKTFHPNRSIVVNRDALETFLQTPIDSYFT